MTVSTMPHLREGHSDHIHILAHIVVFLFMLNLEKGFLTLEQATQFIGVNLVSLRILANV